MSICIAGPFFYDQEDENVFFGCLYSLPSFNKVRGHGQELTITFDNEPDEEIVIRLLVICRRWGINIDPLKVYQKLYNSDCFLWESDIPVENT